MDNNLFKGNHSCLITGTAGFIGFHLAKRLLEEGCTVIGFDNLNDYYEVGLKESRLDIPAGYDGFAFIKGDLGNKADVDVVFNTYNPGIVVNLGA